MKWIASILLASTLVFASGCVSSGNYCDVARPVRPSVDDRLTEGTARKILAENEKVPKLCGVRP
ncbi:hypothetical protein J2X13_003193 [Aminobacter aminovorans]|nr:hypothetical protein [Aminobacter aminovorans]